MTFGKLFWHQYLEREALRLFASDGEDVEVLQAKAEEAEGEGERQETSRRLEHRF